MKSNINPFDSQEVRFNAIKHLFELFMYNTTDRPIFHENFEVYYLATIFILLEEIDGLKILTSNIFLIPNRRSSQLFNAYLNVFVWSLINSYSIWFC